MMSKKTYEQVANAIRVSGPDSVEHACSVCGATGWDLPGTCSDGHSAHAVVLRPNLDALLDALSKVFTEDNPRFNADKFKAACLTGAHIRKSIKG